MDKKALVPQETSKFQEIINLASAKLSLQTSAKNHTLPKLESETALKSTHEAFGSLKTQAHETLKGVDIETLQAYSKILEEAQGLLSKEIASRDTHLAPNNQEK